MKNTPTNDEIGFYLKTYFFFRFSIFILFLFLLSSPLYAGFSDTARVHADQDAVIYVSEGTVIYGFGAANERKIVHVPNVSRPAIAVALLKKSKKTKTKSINNAFSKKQIVSKKLKSDTNIYDPLSTGLSSSFFVSQRLKSGFVNLNFQDFAKFVNPDVCLSLLKRKFLSRDSIFYCSQNQSLCHFSQVFTVRPPPFLW